MDLTHKLILLPALLPALIASAVIHELAHAAVARMLGDLTAKSQGRLTLNPIRHLDAFGSIMFLVTFLLMPFAFGWAKPVPVYPKNFRHPKRDMAIVAAAGPASNLLIAIAVMALVVHVLPDTIDAGGYLGGLIAFTLQVNLVLFVFNLFPMPPLDGSRMIGVFMNDRTYEHWSSLDQYAPIFFLALFFLFGSAFQTLLGAGLEHSWRLVAAIVGG